ncbi:MAG: (2Fe-2S)-binding protein [Bacillus sp. (in: firmicutes)]
MDLNKQTNEGQMNVQLKKEFDLSICVNGQTYELCIPPSVRLVSLLRDYLNLTGTKVSCGIGRCGSCVVLMEGELVNSCLLFAYQADGKSITTIEGIGGERLHTIQEAFLCEGGFQCGYCTSGMIMATKALVDKIPNPTDGEITEALSGNLCRCTGYGGIIRAVKRSIHLANEKESMESEKRDDNGY